MIADLAGLHGACKSHPWCSPIPFCSGSKREVGLGTVESLGKRSGTSMPGQMAYKAKGFLLIKLNCGWTVCLLPVLG